MELIHDHTQARTCGDTLPIVQAALDAPRTHEGQIGRCVISWSLRHRTGEGAQCDHHAEWEQFEPSVSMPPSTPVVQLKELTVRLPVDIAEQVQLAAYAKVAETLDNTVALLLQKGLASVAPEVERALMDRVRKLGAA